MKKLPLENLEEIIKNEKLQIENEDSLMDFVLNLYKSDRNNSSLIEFVIFRNLSNEMIEKFIGLFEIEDLDQKTWESICMRLKQSVSEDETVKDKRYISKGNLIEFKLDSNNKFNGILKYLTDKTGGNIVDNGTVSITSNSANNPVKYLIYFNTEDYFQYIDKSMANVLFDFKDRSVKLNKYSIHTGTWNTNNGHLRNWAIEVSNDGEKWEEIDNRSNDSSLNGCRYSATFDVQKQRNEFYRFVRLRQTGLAWCPSSSNQFEIMYIDFYGFLKEPSSK